jgi:hypothetical protein
LRIRNRQDDAHSKKQLSDFDSAHHGLVKKARPSVSIEFTAIIVATEAPETTMANMTMVAETLSNALVKL